MGVGGEGLGWGSDGLWVVMSCEKGFALWEAVELWEVPSEMRLPKCPEQLLNYDALI